MSSAYAPEYRTSRVAFWIHDRLPNRVAQRIRCSYLFGHFYKWNLGDGESCPWCWAIRHLPVLARWVPYTKEFEDV